MDFKIDAHNIDEWCFRCLEKDLSPEEQKFFDQALEFDQKIRWEYNKWQKTKVRHISDIYVNPDLPNQIIKVRPCFVPKYWTWVALGSVAVTSIVLNIFLLNTNESNNVSPKPIKEQPELKRPYNWVDSTPMTFEKKKQEIPSVNKYQTGVQSNYEAPKSGSEKAVDTLLYESQKVETTEENVSEPLDKKSMDQLYLKEVHTLPDTAKTKRKKVKKAKSNDTQIIKIHDNL